jgi:hypothetical protein
MNTPTPRTNQAVAQSDGQWSFVLRGCSQELERELNAARDKLAEWSILKGWGGTPEIINDFIKGQQTRIHYAQILEEELTAVTEQRDGLRSGIDYASDQLHKVTEQRDEARRLAERYRYLSCDSQEEADETLLPWETTNPNEL